MLSDPPDKTQQNIREMLLAPAYPPSGGPLIPVEPNLRWNAARIPMQLRGRTTEDLALPAPVISAARAFIDSFPARYVPESTPLNQFPEDRSMIGRGLTLTGPHKAGKTSLGCAILTEVASTTVTHPSLTIMFVPFTDYMHVFNERHGWRAGRDMLFEENLAGLETSLSVVMEASLILLDDVGAEHSTASRAAADELYRVVRSRHRRGLVTILTTGLGPQELGEAYSPAMADFMLRSFTHLPVRS